MEEFHRMVFILRAFFFEVVLNFCVIEVLHVRGGDNSGGTVNMAARGVSMTFCNRHWKKVAYVQ